jgi:hypothetical protein
MALNNFRDTIGGNMHDSTLRSKVLSHPMYDPGELQQHYDKVVKYLNREPMRKSALYMDELKVFSPSARAHTLFDVDNNNIPGG